MGATVTPTSRADTDTAEPVPRRQDGLLARAVDSGLVLLVLYGVMLTMFGVLAPNFLSGSNLFNVAGAVATLAIVAAAQTAVLISGGFDLSVGSVAAVASVATAQVLAVSGSEPLANVAALGFGAFVGLVNGLVITRLRVNPLIATLAMLSIVRGLGFVWTDARTVIYPGDLLAFLGRARLFGNLVPASVLLMLAVFAAVWALLRFTVAGRFIYAVGGNPEAAYLAGLPVRRLRLAVYAGSGMAAGLAGLVIASQLIAGSPPAADKQTHK
jgi:ribose transport system permease protein